jgi:hypothetical protein
VVAEIENSKLESFSNKYRAIVVFPEPEGAERMMSLPSMGKSKDKRGKYCYWDTL